MRRFTHLIDGVDNIDMTWDRWYKNVSDPFRLKSAPLPPPVSCLRLFRRLCLSEGFSQQVFVFRTSRTSL